MHAQELFLNIQTGIIIKQLPCPKPYFKKIHLMNKKTNLSSFLKLNRILGNIPQKSISIDTNLDASLISRFESGKRTPNKIQLKMLLNYYGTDEITFFKNDPIIKKRLSDLFTAIYEAHPFDVRERIIDSIPINSIKKTHYYPYLFLLIFCHYVNAGKTNKAKEYYKALAKIVSNFDEENRAIFYMFSSLYHYDINRNDLHLEDLQKLQSCTMKDERVIALSHYFLLASSPSHYTIKTILSHFNKCKEILEKHHNTFRLVMLNMMLAIFYSEFDMVKASITTDLKTLELLKPYYGKSNWIKALHFNLSWSYMRIQDYESAIEHIHLCKQDYENRTIYFMLAFCYFQLNQHSIARTYLIQARNVQPSAKYYDYLIDWLEAMLEYPYQKKCKDILLYIDQKLKHELDYESSQTIFALIIDYYVHCHDLEKMQLYKNKLKLKHVLIKLPKGL